MISDDASAKTVPAVPIRRSRRRQYDGNSPQPINSVSSRKQRACTEPGQMGALLRREGLYSSNLTLWRRQVNEGLIPKKRGPRKSPILMSVVLQNWNGKMQTRP